MTIVKRIENWLLLTPLMLWLFFRLAFANKTFDIHLHDTYFIIQPGLAVLALLVVPVIIPFMVHLLLRLRNKDHFTRVLHIRLSIALMLLIAITGCWVTFTLSGTGMYQFQSDSFNSWFLALLILVFFIVQIAFILIAVNKLFHKRQ